MTDYDTPSTTTGWFSFLAFTVIALVSLLNSLDGNVSEQDRIITWCVTGISICLGLSGLAVVASVLLKEKFVDTPVHGGLATLMFAMWAALLSTLMNPSNNLATGGGSEDFGMYGFIVNANLYFFSWFSFVTAAFIVFGYLKTSFKVGVNDKNKGFDLYRWGGLSISGFVVMMSAIRLFNTSDCDGNRDDIFCRRTVFAVAIGAITSFLAPLWLFIGACLPAIVDSLLAIALFVIWILGIIFITFGHENAPATTIGDLYFSTWACFILTCSLVANGVANMMHPKTSETGEATTAVQETEKQSEDLVKVGSETHEAELDA